MIATVIQLLLVLGLMVLIHELGHFVVAKWCGVRVESFAIGFGTRLWGYVYNGTDYRINALPLGGYVKMAGEIPGEEVSNDPGDLNNHPRWQRMLIAVAGPAANILLALGLMTGAYMAHFEVSAFESGPAITDYIAPTSAAAKTGIQSGDTIVRFDSVNNPTWDDIREKAAVNPNQTVAFSYLHNGERTDTVFAVPAKIASEGMNADPAVTAGLDPKEQDTPIKVFEAQPGSPADRAGLKSDDQIASFDGHQIRSVSALLAYLAAEKGKPVHLDVLRGTQHIAMTVTPELVDSGDASGTKAYHLGFQAEPPPVKVEKLPFARAAAESWDYTKKNSFMLADVLRGMFEHHVSVKQLSGPIGIAVVVHQAAQAGWMPLVATMSMISINLAIFNLLPFPILDGGMIFLLIVESLFRRDLPMPVKERIFQVAFVCILLFAAMVIYNDIAKLPFMAHLHS